MKRPTTICDIHRMMSEGLPIPMITAYDYPSGLLADEAGFPLILVGDSIGPVVFGYDSTIPVTIEDIVRSTSSVSRGVQNALVVADMPFMTFQTGTRDALLNAGRLMSEGGARAVKVEGGRAVTNTVEALDRAGIAVMGHIGLTPQSVHKLGGYHIQGRSAKEANILLEDALALQDAGAFAVVLELLPEELAAKITDRISVPTIGIGAGPYCSGQVQVWHDLLGLSLAFTPKHARQYADLAGNIRSALKQFVDDVKSKNFC